MTILESHGVGRPGATLVRSLLAERGVGGPSETELERELRPLLMEAGLPWPVAQHKIWLDDRLIAVPDFAYPDWHLAIEADGYTAHSAPSDFARDRRRDSLLVSRGWIVLRFSHQQIRHHPEEVIDRCKSTWLRLTA